MPDDELETFRLFIDGKSVDAVSGATFASQNPYPGTAWATIADGGPEDVDLAVASARAAFDDGWGTMSGFARAARRKEKRSIGRRRGRGTTGRKRAGAAVAGPAVIASPHP